MPSTITRIFDGNNIRTIFNKEEEKWYFSVVDVVSVLTESNDGRKYWNKLKQRLKEEGNETVTNCHQLKLKAEDGKLRLTDVIDLEQLFRLIQSIPSKKVEPLKLWLAQVGKERIDETYDPEISINRALETYRRKGYSEEWINRRLKSINVRKEFTDELKRGGINSSKDFAVLTDILTKTWSGLSVRQYKDVKGLTKDNLRDHMTNLELVLTELAELSSAEINKSSNPDTYKEVEDNVIKGATISKNAKEQIENITGKNVISNKNNKSLNREASKELIDIK